MSDPIMEIIVQYMSSAGVYAFVISLAGTLLGILIRAASGKERFL